MAKPQKTSFDIATRKGGRERREGYALGGFGTHKEKGTGEFFWKFTHLATGCAINVWPCHETKVAALAHLALLAEGNAPQNRFVAQAVAAAGGAWGLGL